MPIRLAQISDLHLLGDTEIALRGYFPYHNLQRILAKLLESITQATPEAPDLLLLTGDLTENGDPQAYQHLLRLLKPLPVPIYWLAGNHDDLHQAHRFLSPHYGGVSQPLSQHLQVLNRGEWQFILLNSVHPQAQWGEGFLTPETLADLERILNQNSRPTLIALHHHPVAVGIDWLDQIGVTNGADFLQLIEQFPQVKIVTFGHIHWDMQHRHHHTWFYGCPSSCVQLELPPPHSPHPGFRWFTLWEGGHHDSSVERFAIQRS